MGVGDLDGDGTEDVVWINDKGQVHYWKINDGRRIRGLDVFEPVNGPWTMIGVGDVTGDGTDDLIWQHKEGQVHAWEIRRGQRKRGFDIHIPVVHLPFVMLYTCSAKYSTSSRE